MAGQGFKISLDTSQIEEKLSRLSSVTTDDSPARAAASAGARVYYERMCQAVPVKEGKLRDSLYYHFNVKQSDPRYAIYSIGPNMKEAPHWHLIEYGHQNKLTGRFTPPRSYIRSTLNAYSGEAQKASIIAFQDKVREVMDGK